MPSCWASSEQIEMCVAKSGSENVQGKRTCRFGERFVFPGGCSDVACFGFGFAVWVVRKLLVVIFSRQVVRMLLVVVLFCRSLGIGRVLLPFDCSGNSHRRMVGTPFSTNLSRKCDFAIWFLQTCFFGHFKSTIPAKLITDVSR